MLISGGNHQAHPAVFRRIRPPPRSRPRADHIEIEARQAAQFGTCHGGLASCRRGVQSRNCTPPPPCPQTAAAQNVPITKSRIRPPRDSIRCILAREVPCMRVYIHSAHPAASPSSGLAQQPGPYYVQKTAKVGGVGAFDYVYADSEGRKLYIPAPRQSHPPHRRLQSRHAGVSRRDSGRQRARRRRLRRNPAMRFASSKPVTMWDTKTLAVIKKIDVDGRSRRHHVRLFQ